MHPGKIASGKASVLRQVTDTTPRVPAVIGLAVRDEGDRIALENYQARGIGSSDEPMHSIPIHPGGSEGDPAPEEAGIAQSVRTSSKDVYSGWTIPESDQNSGNVADRAIEAQIAAAVTGRKPLYFESGPDGCGDAG